MGADFGVGFLLSHLAFRHRKKEEKMSSSAVQEGFGVGVWGDCGTASIPRDGGRRAGLGWIRTGSALQAWIPLSFSPAFPVPAVPVAVPEGLSGLAETWGTA